MHKNVGVALLTISGMLSLIAGCTPSSEWGAFSSQCQKASVYLGNQRLVGTKECFGDKELSDLIQENCRRAEQHKSEFLWEERDLDVYFDFDFDHSDRLLRVVEYINKFTHFNLKIELSDIELKENSIVIMYDQSLIDRSGSEDGLVGNYALVQRHSLSSNDWKSAFPRMNNSSHSVNSLYFFKHPSEYVSSFGELISAPGISSVTEVPSYSILKTRSVSIGPVFCSLSLQNIDQKEVENDIIECLFRSLGLSGYWDLLGTHLSFFNDLEAARGVGLPVLSEDPELRCLTELYSAQ